MTLRSLELVSDGRRWRADLGRAASLAIALDFTGPQPSFFAAPAARAEPLAVNGFIGHVAAGGSCNCSTVTLTPHCNGTHTECVGHLVRESVSLHVVARDALLLACVISVTPIRIASATATGYPAAETGDLIITTEQLRNALPAQLPAGCTALVIRTLPNPPDKRVRRYDPEADLPAYFSVEAIEWLIERGFAHLVVDLPSIDRARDQGRLLCHRRFWALPEGSTALADARRADATLTELAFIANDIADGLYLLNLQLPAFASDAAPSRPVLYPLTALDP